MKKRFLYLKRLWVAFPAFFFFFLKKIENMILQLLIRLPTQDSSLDIHLILVGK